MAAPTLSDKITAANAETHRRMLAGEPVLVDVQLARDAIPRLADRTILHAGPPIGWERMCGPMRGAVAGAIVFEGWARDLEDAAKLAASGEIRFEPNHHYDAVGPMTGITTRNMPLLVVENRAFGNRAFCTINEGMGNVMRFGGNEPRCWTASSGCATSRGPALGAAHAAPQAASRSRTLSRAGSPWATRCTAQHRLLEPDRARAGAGLAETAPTANSAASSRFMAGNDKFFLNVAMAMAQGHHRPGARHRTFDHRDHDGRNGTDFGIRVSSTGDTWFTAPGAKCRAAYYFAGFTEADANPDMGDSCDHRDRRSWRLCDGGRAGSCRFCRRRNAR